MRYAYATLALVQIYDLSVARSTFTRQQQQQRKWLSKLKHAPCRGSASAPDDAALYRFKVEIEPEAESQ